MNKFKVGDPVLIANDALLINNNGDFIATQGQGRTGEIDKVPDLNRSWPISVNYQIRIDGAFYLCCEQYLTLTTYCTCGGPGEETGFNTLVIFVCLSCKKEKVRHKNAYV